MPLKLGASQVQADLGLVPRQITFMSGAEPCKNPGSDARALEPDWSIFLHTSPVTIITQGDSKCSSKFLSSERDSANWIWPFRQTLTYCVNSSTRYGFIVTPEELVALHVSKEDGEYFIEYKSVPWGNSGPGGVLTMNLSIWALGLMALNEGHRSIRDRCDTLPLDVWWQGEVPGVFEHHLSSRRVQGLQNGPGVQIRPRPSDIPGFGTNAPETSGRGARRRR